MQRRVPQHQTDRARELRRNATDAERSLWHMLSRYRPKFTRQLPIGPYIVDFACRQAKLVVEIDGSQHLAQAGYDEARTAFLNAEGWRVIRLWNNQVLDDPEAATRHVLEHAAECLGGTHPQPLPFREGRDRRPRYR